MCVTPFHVSLPGATLYVGHLLLGVVLSHLVAGGAGDAVVVLEQRERSPRVVHAVAQLN